MPTFDDIPLLLEDPRVAPGKDDLVALRRAVEPPRLPGQGPSGAALLETCGWGVSAVCPEHRERFKTNRSCRLLDHAACPTDATERVRALQLGQAPEGGSYRVVWLGLPFALPDGCPEGAPDDPYDHMVKGPEAWSTALRGVAMHWGKAVQRVARRKAGRGLLSRSISFVMGRPQSVAHLKLLFVEDQGCQTDAAIDALCREMGAAVIGDRKLATAELAVLQLMEDTMSHLTALQTLAPELYASWFYGVGGLRLFQSYGILFGQLQEGWVRGEATLSAGMGQAKVEHGLGSQVVVEAQPLGFLPKGWKRKGRVDARGWEVTSSFVKLEQPADRSITFSWRARQDTTPRCDICGKGLEMVLVPPSGAR